jgi:pyrimidine operon attenuation protein/uracil phosphoribosyltransferase
MQVVADASKVAELVAGLAESMEPAVRGWDRWALVGLRRRGDVLADRLAARLHPTHVGTLDITLYRDDLSEIGPQPVVRTTEIDFDIDGLNVVLVDDVLMTGRSARAALQELIDFGRPESVKLAVLVDRGGRELPIAADYVGLTLDARPREHVLVHLEPTDEADEILTTPAGEEGPATP